MYNLYITEDGVESLVSSESDPRKIRRIVVGRSMSRRLSRPGRSLRLTLGGKNMTFPNLERVALDLWFEDCESLTRASQT